MVIVLVAVVVMVVMVVDVLTCELVELDVTNVVILHHLFEENVNWPLLAVLCSNVIVHAHCLLAKHCIYQQ